MIKKLFGKIRADGGFDMRIKSNKGGWIGKMGRSAVGGKVAELGVSGYLGAKKAVGEGFSELGNEALVAFAPAITEMLNENAWKDSKKRPNESLNEFILNLPSAETEKKSKIIEYIDKAFENSASFSKRYAGYGDEKKWNEKPERLKKIEIDFEMMDSLFWVNKRFFRSSMSEDMTPSLFKSTSLKKQFRSAKENKILKDFAMKYYNGKSDEIFEGLFSQTLEFFGDDENLGTEYKKKYLKYEKARFEITLLNNSYFSIPKIWFKRVFNIEKEE